MKQVVPVAWCGRTTRKKVGNDHLPVTSNPGRECGVQRVVGEMELVMITLQQARQFTELNHRHHTAPPGHKFSIGLEHDGELIGVAMVGRPVSRHLDNGRTLEITRLTTNGHKNACSKLYSACVRAGKALGAKKIVTYILETEPGTSLKATGFKRMAEAGGGHWGSPSRPRDIQMKLFGREKYPQGRKVRWERLLKNENKADTAGGL